MADMRKTQRWDNFENIWLDCPMMELQNGDRFRMFEPTGEPVIDNRDGTTEWIVIGKPSLTETGIPSVTTE
jgi:hypothetical protein